MRWKNRWEKEIYIKIAREKGKTFNKFARILCAYFNYSALCFE